MKSSPPPIDIDIQKYNNLLQDKSPGEIVAWALAFAKRPVLTSNFGPYATSLIHLCVSIKKDLPIIWCDTGFNTETTYKHIENVRELLHLNLKVYTSSLSTGFIDYYYGVPKPENRTHSLFTEMVKLEPFRRAMKEHDPDVWFTNIRKGQTQHRNNLNILSYNRDGVLKVSPFYHWSNKKLYAYIQEHNLPNEFDYFDPTKASDNRECGLHLT